MRKTKTDRALAALNTIRGLKYSDIGYTYFANITGDGRNFRTIYTTISAGGGGAGRVSPLNTSTAQGDLAKIRDALCAEIRSLPDFAVISRAIHEREVSQEAALLVLDERGLWLSPAQRAQAGLKD